MSQVTIGISDMRMGKDDTMLVTFALGSCVGICMYDPVIKVGALGHIMLPTMPNPGTETNINKYADTCIPNMLKQLMMAQCSKARLITKIAGGAKMFAVSGDSTFGNIGERNIKAVKESLRLNGIRLYAEDTGLDFGRTVYFNIATGIVEVKAFNKPIKFL